MKKLRKIGDFEHIIGNFDNDLEEEDDNENYDPVEDHDFDCPQVTGLVTDVAEAWRRVCDDLEDETMKQFCYERNEFFEGYFLEWAHSDMCKEYREENNLA